MQKILYAFIINIIITTAIYAENKSQDWSVLHNGEGSIVEVYDDEKQTKVIEFSSHSIKDTYINGAKKGTRAWKNRKSKTIRWSFKYSQNYVIIITLATIKGYRNLIYTANDKNFKSYIGLGSATIKGEWITITRNLEEDLHKQDPTNSILAVNGFAIRGDGRVSNVYMLKRINRSLVRSFYHTIQEALLYLKNDKYIKESLVVKEVKPKVKVKPKNIKNRNNKNIVPTITLINGDKIYLNLGENFIDPGVIAEDSNGIPLDVEFIGDVNTSQVDSYPLHYLAIDKNGNATSVTRVVVVMSKDIKKVKVKKYKKMDDKKETVESDKSEIQLAINDIVANAMGDTQEEKLENIAILIDELIDKNE